MVTLKYRRPSAIDVLQFETASQQYHSLGLKLSRRFQKYCQREHWSWFTILLHR